MTRLPPQPWRRRNAKRASVPLDRTAARLNKEENRMQQHKFFMCYAPAPGRKLAK